MLYVVKEERCVWEMEYITLDNTFSLSIPPSPHIVSLPLLFSFDNHSECVVKQQEMAANEDWDVSIANTVITPSIQYDVAFSLADNEPSWTNQRCSVWLDLTDLYPTKKGAGGAAFSFHALSSLLLLSSCSSNTSALFHCWHWW